ncbi:hypothetical protein PHMEG_00041366, partial [Phytophthora megakarya]
MLPRDLAHACNGYAHVEALVDIAKSGVQAPLSKPLPRQDMYPTNHKSAYPVLVKNIHKEQDVWSSTSMSSLSGQNPFGVVDKGDADPQTTGRVIHDLSFPERSSVNDVTDTASIRTPEYERCDAVATEIIHQQESYPDAEVLLQAGDVNAAFHNVCTHSESVYLFGGRLLPDNELVIDTSSAFGWCQLRCYWRCYCLSAREIPKCLQNSRPVDDHINVAATVGSNCTDVEHSLRQAMITVLGHGSINEDKFTAWASRQKIMGLIFDSVKRVVAMPESKIQKAVAC